MPKATTEIITIGGLRLRYAGPVTTLEHDIATQAQIQRAGVSRLELLPAETLEDYALRIFRTAVGNGNILLLIAHLLVPEEMEPKEWKPDVSDRTARFLGGLTDAEDKARIQGILRDTLMGFLGTELIYAVRLLTASNQETEEPLSPDQTTA